MSYRFDTLAIHAAQPDDETTGAVTTPIYQTSTYAQIEPGVHKGYCYSRTGNPIRQALEENLAALEGARYGVAFASGMSAIHCVASLLKKGDHVVSTRDLYGGAWRIFTKYFAKFGIDFTFVDASDISAIAEAIRPETKLLWLETPSNPLLRITDIAAAAAVAKHAGVRVVVDNTFASPVLQRPLELGADLVVHSTTKYINGHSDVIGGAVLTNDQELFTELKFLQNAIGAIPGPQDCFLVLRGIKTLALRVNRHCDNAETLAAWLREQAGVKRVIYPAFTDHPGHEIARRQMTRFGAIVSFELDADVPTTVAFTKHLKLWTLAESLGSVRSLFCHPPTMTHASVEPDVRRQVGIGDGLIRLSVGLEDVRDLIDDLQQALAQTRVSAPQTEVHA
ncbi:MAG TPA: PLP-dependent aspartate aminotransferase family protein [Thermoanaerobaculia bacterium]|nr:PLP-dependent aspartate aminotransferase family protein [Thermoanaerobaculia bacterium]